MGDSRSGGGGAPSQPRILPRGQAYPIARGHQEGGGGAGGTGGARSGQGDGRVCSESLRVKLSAQAKLPICFEVLLGVDHGISCLRNILLKLTCTALDTNSVAIAWAGPRRRWWWRAGTSGFGGESGTTAGWRAPEEAVSGVCVCLFVFLFTTLDILPGVLMSTCSGLLKRTCPVGV